jgi:hypothetical protein
MEDLLSIQVHDRMTEQVYVESLKSFVSPVTPGPVFTVPVLEQGRRALEEINEELGLAFDEQACLLCLPCISTCALHACAMHAPLSRSFGGLRTSHDTCMAGILG